MDFDAHFSDRLSAISRCMCELERMTELRVQYPSEMVGIMVGELDWLVELHNLLYRSEIG
jgi:hypothetical protein